MTVCIASHCLEEKVILLASDTMISTQDMSADSAAFKFAPIGETWFAQFAGNDVGSVTPIIRKVRSILEGRPDTLDNVTTAFSEAYGQALRQKARMEVLFPLGYDSLEDFRAKGYAELGADVFVRTLVEIQQQSIDVQFLVAGFDEGQEAHIFTVSNPGKISYYDAIQFWAIGSGQTSALGSFFNLKQLARFCDLPTNLYRICEAKFNAENAVGVGKETVALLLYPDGKRYVLTIAKIEGLRKFWEKTRVATPPDGANQIAKGLIEEAKSGANIVKPSSSQT